MTDAQIAGSAAGMIQGEPMRIAALDVETSEIELIQLAMTAIGHECHGFEEAASLQREMRDPGYDLLILARSLADVEGVWIVKWVREELGSLIPVLLVRTVTKAST